MRGAGQAKRVPAESMDTADAPGSSPSARPSPPVRRAWRHRAALLVLASALGLGAGWLSLAGPWREPAHEASPSPGVLWPNPRPIGAFSLQDHRGRAFTHERLDGVWTFLFFGYTHCPDICPTTLATLRRVEQDLPAHPPVPRQHVLVSVDPARDTVEHLARYVAAFGPELIGVTGSDGELAKLARDVGAAYFRSEPDDDGAYFVDHTASIMLVDPHGRLVALFGMPHDAAAIAARFLELEQAAGANAVGATGQKPEQAAGTAG